MGQPEVGIGTPPGAGAIQHLTRLLGRGRALEAVLTSADFDAELAERHGWINRALPDAELDEFVAAIARRMEVKGCGPAFGREGQRWSRTRSATCCPMGCPHASVSPSDLIRPAAIRLCSFEMPTCRSPTSVKG